MGLIVELLYKMTGSPLPDGIPRSWVKDKKYEGWYVTHADKERIVLRHPRPRSWFWWSVSVLVTLPIGGLGFIIYEYLQRFARAEKRVVRPEDFEDSSDSGSGPEFTDVNEDDGWDDTPSSDDGGSVDDESDSSVSTEPLEQKEKSPAVGSREWFETTADSPESNG